VRSIRVFAKNLGDPYYEPTIVVHDSTVWNVLSVGKYNTIYCASTPSLTVHAYRLSKQHYL